MLLRRLTDELWPTEKPEAAAEGAWHRELSERLAAVDSAPLRAITAELASASEPVANAKRIPPKRAQQPKPEWVDDNYLVEPCTSGKFAKLVGVSVRTLSRWIDGGQLWRGESASKKKFWFYLKDHDKQRQLHEACLRSSGSRR